MGKKQKKVGMKMDTLQCSTLREVNTGKKHVDVNTMLSIKFLQRIATWAAGEADVPPLAALYGRQLASTAEAAGVPVDPSIFLCERCETVLLPGSNCSVRIETNKKRKKNKKARCGKIPQNNVVYYCNFCSHSNVMRGTPSGYVKELIESRTAAWSSDLKPERLDEETTHVNATDKAEAVEESPRTPLENSSKIKRMTSASTSNKAIESTGGTINSIESTGGTNKRKRKRNGWLSLKEIARRNEAENTQSINSLFFPFQL